MLLSSRRRGASRGIDVLIQPTNQKVGVAPTRRRESWPRLLSPEQPHRNAAIRASVWSLEPLVPPLAALVFFLVAFVLLTSGEAWAAEQRQPDQTQTAAPQGGTNVASQTPPIEGAKEAVEPLPTAPDETVPVGAHPVRTETLSVPPADPARTTPEAHYYYYYYYYYSASQRSAPQSEFALTMVNGKVVESDPPRQAPPPTSTSSASRDARPAPQDAAVVPDQRYAPRTTSEGLKPLASSSDGGDGPEPAAGPVSGNEGDPLAPPSVSSDPTPQEASDPVPWPTMGPEPLASGENDPPPVFAGGSPAPSVADTSVGSAAHNPPGADPTVPIGVGGQSRLPSGLGIATNTMSNAVNGAAKVVHDAAASVAAEISGILASGSSVDPSSDATHDPSQEEEAPQPMAPLAPAEGGSGFFSPAGGGQAGGSAGGVAPLLLLLLWGVLASVLALLRHDGWRYLASSCRWPKPISALLSPLERPG